MLFLVAKVRSRMRIPSWFHGVLPHVFRATLPSQTHWFNKFEPVLLISSMRNLGFPRVLNAFSDPCLEHRKQDCSAFELASTLQKAVVVKWPQINYEMSSSWTLPIHLMVEDGQQYCYDLQSLQSFKVSKARNQP